MYVFTAPNRDVFLANAHGAAIEVVRTPTAQAVRDGEQVRIVPAVELTYSFLKGDQQWVFREVALGNDRGVDLGQTLLADLVRRKQQYELVQRSGSF